MLRLRRRGRRSRKLQKTAVSIAYSFVGIILLFANFGATVLVVVTDPEDPRFDLEKLIAKWEKESS